MHLYVHSSRVIEIFHRKKMHIVFLLIFLLLPFQIADADHVSIACGHDSLQMSCDKAVIIIQRAIYGREDNRTCRPASDARADIYDPTRCQTLIDMTAVVRYHCQFQQLCDFDVSEIPFDFDCINFAPYLRVSYNCLPLIGDLPRSSTILAALTGKTSTSTITTTTKAPSTTTKIPSTTEMTTQESVKGHTSSTNSISNIADAIITEALAEAVVGTPNDTMAPNLEKTTVTTPISATTTPTAPSSPAAAPSQQQQPPQAHDEILYPIMGTNDLLSGWATCDECELCIQRSGRIKCFFVLHNLTWVEAKQSCADTGGELATVRSDIETRFLNRTKYILGMQNTNAWIGLRWKGSSWLWIDDVKLDWELSYSVFAPGEPDNWSGFESCIEFIGSTRHENLLDFYTGYWNDADCQLRHDAICQKHWVLA